MRNVTAAQPDGIPLAVRLAANHVSVSARERVAPADFLRTIAGDDLPMVEARLAVETFLFEADPNEIADLVACGATTFPRLARIASAALPPSHPNRIYLERLAA